MTDQPTNQATTIRIVLKTTTGQVIMSDWFDVYDHDDDGNKYTLLDIRARIRSIPEHHDMYPIHVAGEVMFVNRAHITTATIEKLRY